ncbi:FAD/NAD(P)-binding domain-containing protein [Pseudohyphozyma bogoriensis]|nr:FAD/NAD(P)-binding domain-containing protein [Pseudohyphozyma bogoriensis]
MSLVLPLRKAVRPVPAARTFATSSVSEKQRLVILGSGWGGYELARKVNKSQYDVTMVSPNTYFAFTTAVGTLEYRCALEPVRRFGDKITSYQAWADAIDLKHKKITCMPATAGAPVAAGTTGAQSPDGAFTVASFPGTKPFELKYDKLVVAVGAYSQTFNTPGVKEYAHFLKDVKDARRIRTRIMDCFSQASQPTLTDVERKNLLHFVVVGGGPTGIEFAAELHDLIRSDLTRFFPSLAPMARITIYDVAPTILAAFDEGLVEYAEKKFAREGVEIRNNRHVTSVNETSLEIEEEGNVPFGMLVWSTGLSPNPLISTLTDLKQDPKSKSLMVDNYFKTSWADGGINHDVFAIGDNAMLESGKLPATAQVANQEAKHLAKVLNNAVLDRAPPKEFEFKNAGIMTYVGSWEALFDRSGASEGPKMTEAGRVAWLLWRSAYWSQSLSLRNKAQLAFYWFLNWIFGRDVSRF